MQDHLISGQINKILDLQTEKKVIFLNKYPEINENKDGFFQRVLRVDLIFKDYLRIYLNIQGAKSGFNIIRISELCYQINLNLEMEISKEILKFLALSVSMVYAHSIYSLTNWISQTLFAGSHNAIWDVHGVVPEEVAYLTPAKTNFIKLISDTELFAYLNSKLVICVSNKLTQHLKQKYKNCKNFPMCILMPIFTGEFDESLLNKQLSKKPQIIYSGGTQAWQLMPQMLQYVYANKEIYEFIFLVADTVQVKLLYSRLFNGESFPGILKSVDPKEVFQYYKAANFGLIFREDNIVNNVSCPTKLIEYLANGIVPIVNSKNIGDFNDLGYITLSNDAKISLSQDEYNKIIHTNFQIIKQLYNQLEPAKTELYNLAGNVDFTSSNNQLSAVFEYFKLSQKLLVLKKRRSWKIKTVLRKIFRLFRN